MSEDDLPLEARLIRDLICWIEERGQKPMLLAARAAVVGDMPGVPADAAHVLLNVSKRAIRNTSFADGAMTFTTGFGPIHTTVSIPFGAVLQIGSAAEEGFVGMVFRTEAEAAGPKPSAAAGPGAEPKRRFRIVRDDEG